jgi:hypothetical protein
MTAIVSTSEVILQARAEMARKRLVFHKFGVGAVAGGLPGRFGQRCARKMLRGLMWGSFHKADAISCAK